jgi:hypothetical protein
MAYNPFNIFRRNQKALFAVLTVFIMIVFTLSSGVAGGDFFDVFGRWLGGKGSGAKDVLAKIDGHKVTVGELEGPRGIKFRRVMANRFMSLAAAQTARSLEASISEQLPRLSEEGQQTAFQAMQIAGMIRRQPLTPEMAQGLSFLANQMTAKIESPTARTEDREVARAAQKLFLLLGQASGDFYFYNAPNRTQRDLIEFMLWEKKADQLGIRFTRSDVNKLIQTEFAGYFKSDVEVRKAMQSTPGFTMEAVLDAIASEFRVRAAQTAVLGYIGRFHAAPAFPTPFELFEFYREQTSPTTYDVLSVPAAAFVDKVVGEPTENEISDLFKKYASDEPNPRSETPGFKEPRKISVAYLGITGEEPYYKKLATEQLKVGEVMAKASGALTTPLPGALGTWVAGAVAPLSLKEPAVDAAYAAYVREFNELHKAQNYERSALPGPRSRFMTRESDDPLLPTSTVRPGVAAAALGAFVGQTAGLGNVGTAATLSMTAPLAYEIRDRIKTGMPLVLGMVPSPALMQTALGGVAKYRANEPKPLSIEAMRPELLKQTIDKRAQTLAFGERPNFGEPSSKPLEKGDIQRFTEELGKLTENGKPKDRAAADKFIKDFIAARGLTHFGASTAQHDEWTLEDDPGLQPLVQAQKESLRDARSAHGGQYLPFGRSFFWTSVPDQMDPFRMRRGPATTGTYQAQTYPPGDPTSRADGRPHYVVWRTEDVPAKPNNAVTARPAVIAAWKRQKARAMAEAYANALADTIRKSPNTDPFLLNRLLQDLQVTIKDPKASERAKLFQIANVAPLTTDILGRVQPFGLQESADIPYPTPEMVTALLENRDKPVKTVLVLPDAPKDTFYVATLMSRRLKEPFEFKQDVFSSRGGGFGGPTLGQVVNERFREERMMRSRQSVVELLKKEFKYEETEEQKKKLDENTKSGGRGND